MKTLLISLFSILFLSNTNGSEEKDLRELVNSYVKAVEELDLELAKSIWSQDEKISFIHPKGHQKSWKEIREGFYLGAMGSFGERKLAVKDLEIHILDDVTAWGVFYWEFNATFKDGKKITTKGRETQVWKKEDGGWKIVHVHYSGMPVKGEREGF
jgi:ketosteroid isomerase-like protein